MVVVYLFNDDVLLLGTLTLFDKTVKDFDCVKAIHLLANWRKKLRQHLALGDCQEKVVVHYLFVKYPQPGVCGKHHFAPRFIMSHLDGSHTSERVATDY